MTPLSKLLDLLCPLRVRYRQLKADYEVMSAKFALVNNELTPEQRTKALGPISQWGDRPFDISGLPCVTHVDLRTWEPKQPDPDKWNPAEWTLSELGPPETGARDGGQG